MENTLNNSQRKGRKGKGRGLRLSLSDSSAVDGKNRITARDLVAAIAGQKQSSTPSRKNKYNNIKTADGFDSKKEANYFSHLQLLKNVADPDVQVIKIERQVAYELIPAQYDCNGRLLERACRYFADFRVTRASGKVDVIDTKGVRTSEYRIKRKLMLSVYGIRVMEV